ncbi:restriction endonuclease subunit S [Streptomyces sp. ME18-1-4]|uniref:restriction endonuclease subunit S n=1 Tax=Streptomyces sp. ME18-1-4 TaxID=3028685 RepID=UPI0029AC5F1A|nr:restriction endonuclease subunit S [Streptomyces sp. ME18-1-4]MDX3246990.1 restriction endonuclease subunit S [Streptomyces sp. ME18-1-4]
MQSGTYTVEDLQRRGVLLVEDGNHGEYRPRAEEIVPSGTSLVRATDMLSGRISFEETQKINSAAVARIRKGIGADLDVILSHKGTVGKVSFVPEGSPRFVCSPQTTFWRSLDHSILEPRFIYYYLQSRNFVNQLRAQENETDMAAYVSLTQQRQLRVEVPDIKVQCAIVEVLGALDDKIALNERHAKTVLELAGCVYERESTTSHRWLEIALGDTAKWLSGGTPKTSEPSYWGGGIPWISAASLKTPWLCKSERRVTELGVRNGTRLVPKGTILFVVRGMSLTTEFRVGVAQREVAFGQDCKALIPHPGIDSATLFLAIRSQSAKVLGMVDLAGHGTGRLVTERVASLPVRLPQGEAAVEFAARSGALLDRAVAVTNENRTLADLRDTLLPQLLSGKLRVRDAVRAVEEVA